MIRIPRQFKFLFWDTSPERLSFQKHKQYIIERILEYGDFDADRWLLTKYSEDDLVDVVKKSKRISLKTASFYSLKYNIDKKEIQFFKNPFKERQNRFS